MKRKIIGSPEYIAQFNGPPKEQPESARLRWKALWMSYRARDARAALESIRYRPVRVRGDLTNALSVLSEINLKRHRILQHACAIDQLLS